MRIPSLLIDYFHAYAVRSKYMLEDTRHHRACRSSVRGYRAWKNVRNVQRRCKRSYEERTKRAVIYNHIKTVSAQCTAELDCGGASRLESDHHNGYPLLSTYLTARRGLHRVWRAVRSAVHSPPHSALIFLICSKAVPHASLNRV